jgi:hypothetical protein
MAYAPKGNIATIPVTNMKWPEQGPTSSFLGSFAMPNTYTIELNKHETSAKVDLPQTLFFDASLSTGSVILTFSGTQQTLTLPAQSAGYIPIVTTDQPSFTIVGAGGGSIGLTFLSVPLPASVWSVAAGGATSVTAAQGLPNTAANAWPVYLTSGGTANSNTNPEYTEDVLLATTISGGKVAVSDAAGDASLATIVTETTATATNTGAVSAIITGGKLAVSDSAAETSLATIVTETTATVTALSATAAPVAPGAATATKSDLIGLEYTAAPSEWTAGQQGSASANAYGSLLVDTEVQSPTYGTAAGPSVAASAVGVPTFWVRGSATKTLRIKRIILSAASSGTTAAAFSASISRASGSTAYSGASVSAGTPAQFDINDPAASGTVGANNGGTVTGGPTIGNVLRYAFFDPSTTVLGGPIEFDFSSGGKSLVLRGTSDWIVITCSNSSASATALQVMADWTEV